MTARVSSFCAAGGCVFVQLDGDRVRVWDDGAPDMVLSVPRHAWEAFVAGVRAGEFDLDALAEDPA